MPCKRVAAYLRYVYRVAAYPIYVYRNSVSVDQCHIYMCYRAVAWVSDVTYVCAIELRGLKVKMPVVTSAHCRLSVNPL